MLVAMVVREAEAARKETSQPSVGVMLLEQGLENCRSVNGFFFFFLKVIKISREEYVTETINGLQSLKYLLSDSWFKGQEMLFKDEDLSWRLAG